MGTPNDGSFARGVTSNHSDGNVYDSAAEPPFLRHSWNPDNTLAQWRARFGEDARSRSMPIDIEMRGTGFRLMTTDGLDATVPLPAAVDWRPAAPGRVGCSRTRWP